MKPGAPLPLLLACACAPPPEPRPTPPPVIALDTIAPSGSAAGDPAAPDAAATAPPAPAPSPSLDPATCQAQSDRTFADCRWSVAYRGRCGGAALAHEPPPTPTCVCNGCLDDADCTARPRGKCQTFYSVCSPPEKACVYPGDPCADDGAACSKRTYRVPGNRVPERKQCTHDGHGHAVCGPRQSAPP